MPPKIRQADAASPIELKKSGFVQFLATHFVVASVTVAVVVGLYEQFRIPTLNDKITKLESNVQETTRDKETLTHELLVARTKPTIPVNGVLIAPGSNKHKYAFSQIDTRSFVGGGTLVINITLGTSSCPGSFDLFPEKCSIPTYGRAIGSLASVYDLPPGQTRTLTYHFTAGQVFKFGAEGNWDAVKGTTNSFRMIVSVE